MDTADLNIRYSNVKLVLGEPYKESTSVAHLIYITTCKNIWMLP